jgi:hypothetical protein
MMWERIRAVWSCHTAGMIVTVETIKLDSLS